MTAAPLSAARAVSASAVGLAAYALLGVAFGIVLIRSEVASWFRIQEMFQFQSPRMYLIIGSALLVAAASLALLRRFDVRALNGEAIHVPPKQLGTGARYWIGGGLFGVGWALTGACPGPMVAQLGNGTLIAVPMIVAAVAGSWVYGWLRERLPH